MFVDSLNQYNSLLPEPIRNRILDDDRSSWDEVEVMIKKLAESDKAQQRSSIIVVLFSTYVEKVLSVPMKTKVLSVMSRLCKSPDHEKISFSLPWIVLWNEALSLCTRSKKTESIASEQLTINLVKQLVTFLHDARQLIPSTDHQVIVDMAMDKLKDTRQVSSVEGVILLVHCLPSDFKGYDTYLTQWMSLWTSIEHNSDWDYCWITIFTRAKKYTKTFDWSSIKPIIYYKIKELLKLPAVKGSLLLQQADSAKICLYKLTKILYFLSYQGDIVTADPITVSSPKLPLDTSTSTSDAEVRIPGLNIKSDVFSGMADLTLFLQSIRVYFYPSNTGSWTSQIAYLLSTIIAEMGRHVGKSLAYKLYEQNHSNNDNDDGDIYILKRAIHVPTIRYLGGVLISFLMESLYSKNPMVTQFAGSSLQSLCVIDPSFGEIILPFLLSALDPSAVNQSHQAPSALYAISCICKHLIYPKPVILNYLPDIMKLSLNGIDPNDSRKCAMTLNMYSSILSWIPIRSYGLPDSDEEDKETSSSGTSSSGGVSNISNANIPPTYLSIVDSTTVSSASLSPAITGIEYDLLLANIGPVLVDWAVLFIDKIYTILDTKDAPQKGKNVGMGIGPFVHECLQIFFHALDETTAKIIALQLLEKIKTSTSINASKDFSKIFDSMLTSCPSLLPIVLNSLLENTNNSNSNNNVNIITMMKTFSTEKISFRIRLIGGAIRKVQGSNLIPYIPDILQIISHDFLHHTDKSVRKSTCKLLRDMLRCLTSCYVIESSPYSDSRSGYPLAAPNLLSTVQLKWHIPSKESLSVAVRILNQYATTAMNDIRESFDKLMSSASTSTSTTMDTLTVKKTEELIVNNLSLLRYSLRGSVEILGDTIVTNTNTTSSSSSTSTSTSNEIQSPSPALLTLEIVKAAFTAELSIEEKKYLSELRCNILNFLSNIHELLSTDTITNIYSSISNNIKIRTVWMKIFNIAVTSRMCWMKNVDLLKKYYNIEKRMNRSVIVQRMQYTISKSSKLSNGQYIGINNEFSNVWCRFLLEPNYWEGHDLSMHNIADRIGIQRALRLKELSFAATRISTNEVESSPYMVCLQQLSSLCGHEYDAIRNKANKYFQETSSRFGWRMMEIIKPLLIAIGTPGTTYPVAAGAFAILSQDRIIKRITGQWELSMRFLQAIARSHLMIAAVLEADKRNILMDNLSDFFVLFARRWHQMTFPADISSSTGNKESFSELSSPMDFMCSLLSEMSMSSTSTTATSTSTPITDNESDITAVSNGNAPSSSSSSSANIGLRHELFAAFTVLQFIGNVDITVPSGTWTWAIKTVCTTHGSPTQMIALSALTKLCYMTTWKPLDSCTRGIISDILIDSQWSAIIQGLSHGHNKTSERAQWSRGIDQILRSSEYMRHVLPRTVCSIVGDKALFSGVFHRENAGVFSVLPSLTTSGLCVSTVANMITSSKDIPSTNEEELRINNATRAEIMGGLLRAVYTTFTSIIISNVEKENILQLLCTFLMENIQKVSLDYCKDWAEALAFGMSGTPICVTDAIPMLILDNIRRIFKGQEQNESGGSSSTSSTSTSEDGFAKQTKYLVLARSLLYADINATSDANISISSFGTALLNIMIEDTSDVILTYRTSRLEVSLIIAALSNISIQKTDLNPLINKIVLRFESNYKDSQIKSETDDMDVVTTTTAFDNDSNADNDSKQQSPKDTENLSVPTSTSSGSFILKQISELTDAWLDELVHYTPQWRSVELLPTLFNLMLKCSGHSEIEVAKAAHECCLLVVQSIAPSLSTTSSTNTNNTTTTSTTTMMIIDTNLLLQVTNVLFSLSNHTSWHVRETVILCITILFTNNWMVMSLTERKRCKDIMNDGLNDSRPEVQFLSKLGMTMYLVIKPISELQILVNAYVKNSDTLATRERKKRKLIKDNVSNTTTTSTTIDKPDRVYVTTIMMMSSIIMSFPYDLPAFMPVLLSSFVKHLQTSSLKDTVAKAIQDFKRTHQDRWDDFKLKFSHDQLDDLQGAGAAHYFS